VSDPVTDDEPFTESHETIASGRPSAGAARRDEATRSLTHRARVVAWGRSRGFETRGSFLEREVDGVRVRIALYEVLEGAATVRGAAPYPVPVTFSVERRTGMQRLLSLLASSSVRTGDAAFDGSHHVATAQAELVTRLLDERCRAAFKALPATFLATYREGHIELWIGDDALAGRHLLQAAEAVAALGRAALPDAPYR
jgi:hypothetical protein